MKGKRMRTLFACLTLTTSLFGQAPEEFKTNAEPILKSLEAVGTTLLPDGIKEATDLASIKALRVKAAEDQVTALEQRYNSGLDNINYLLNAQIELALARVDTTDNKEEQLVHIQTGLTAALQTWQRVKELQKIGARGGDHASEAKTRNQVLRFYVWWHKWKAGQDVGFTLARPSLIHQAK